ncbi:MAG: hypothetical protein LH472_11290 [Pyrinomonadaceae bacterium]|nr:hypothetical protein [Pyrinomonadaceae bacterium]
MNLSVEEAAPGIIDIVNENRFGALRRIAVQRGLDPGDFALVAFGGAGPLHGNYLSKLSGAFPCISSPTPGVLSALGFLHSDIKNEFSQTMIRPLDKIDPKKFGEIFSAPGTSATDGRTLTKERNYPKGDPHDQLSSDELKRKFAVLAEGILDDSQRETVFQSVNDLENVAEIGDLMKLPVK